MNTQISFSNEVNIFFQTFLIALFCPNKKMSRGILFTSISLFFCCMNNRKYFFVSLSSLFDYQIKKKVRSVINENALSSTRLRMDI
jgi:hypothetical protein